MSEIDALKIKSRKVKCPNCGHETNQQIIRVVRDNNPKLKNLLLSGKFFDVKCGNTKCGKNSQFDYAIAYIGYSLSEFIIFYPSSDRDVATIEGLKEYIEASLIKRNAGIAISTEYTPWFHALCDYILLSDFHQLNQADIVGLLDFAQIQVAKRTLLNVCLDSNLNLTNEDRLDEYRFDGKDRKDVWFKSSKTGERVGYPTKKLKKIKDE
jgi:ribosomal protein S27E